MKMKDSKRKLKNSKHLLHSRTAYGILHRGKVYGGLSNPHLYTLAGAKEWIHDVPKNAKIIKIRITHEVIAEVIV